MASVRKRNGKYGLSYNVRVRVKGHPGVSQTFDRKSDAHRWGEDTEEALRNGGYVGDAPPGDMSFGKALDRYLSEVSTKKKLIPNGVIMTLQRLCGVFFCQTS